MIALVLGSVFVIACLIALVTYLLEGTAWASIVAIKVFMVIGHLILIVLSAVFGSMVWMLWWIVAPKHAMAGLRKAQASQRAKS